MSHALALCGASKKWPFRLTVTIVRNGTDFSMEGHPGSLIPISPLYRVTWCFAPLLLRSDIMR